MNLKDAVLKTISLEKIADGTPIPHDVEAWQPAILNAFYSAITSVPKDAQINVVISNVDEERGYAKGSITVVSGQKQINFPIIVKDFKLCPFDIMVTLDNNNEIVHMPATQRNVTRAMARTELGMIAPVLYPGDESAADIKMPGNVAPKVPTSRDMTVVACAMIGTPKEELEKVAARISSDRPLMASFAQNTQEKIAAYFTEAKNNVRMLDHPFSPGTGVADIHGIFEAKKMVSVIENELVDPTAFEALVPSNICEVRARYIPSAKDFMLTTNNANERVKQFKEGVRMIGLYLSAIRLRDVDEGRTSDNRNVYFISIDGKYGIKKEYGWGKDRDFYGITLTDKKFPNDVKMIDSLVNDIFDKKLTTYSGNKDLNPNTFAEHLSGRRTETKYNGGGGYDSPCCSSDYNGNDDYLGIYGSNGNYFCLEIGKVTQSMMVNGKPVVKTQDFAIVPASIKTVIKVDRIDDPVLRMSLGDVKEIYLVPDTIRYFNQKTVKWIKSDNLIQPADAKKDLYELYPHREETGEKEAIKTASVSISDVASQKFIVKSAGVERINHLQKKAGDQIETDAAGVVKVLGILGVEKTAAAKAMQLCIEKLASGRVPTARIFGVADDFIAQKKASDVVNMETRIRPLMEKAAEELRTDLIKEASLLQDPEAVDTVLSLNFINPDNLMHFVGQIPNLQETQADIAEMLIASRLGLKTLDETALKNCMNGLERVIVGLEKIKMSFSPQSAI